MKRFFVISALALSLAAQQEQQDDQSLLVDENDEDLPDFTVDDLEVVFSFEIMRHSHRPVLHKSPVQSGQIPITEIGRRNAFRKGMQRKQEYGAIGLLRDSFLPKRSIFMSTDTLRTEMTTQAFYSGIFPFEETIMTNSPLWEVK